MTRSRTEAPSGPPARTAPRGAALAPAFLVAGLAVALAALPPGTAFAVDPAIAKQAKDPDSFKRSDAARALAAEGSADAAKILAELLADKNPYVRDYTVIEAAKLKEPAAVDALAAAAKSKDEVVRRSVAAALGKTASPTALPHLEKLAGKDAAASVRREAFDALWEFKKNPAALTIAAAGLADPDASVRAAAVEAVGRIGTDAARDLVRKALTDPDEGVRIVARMEMRFVARDEALTLFTSGVADPSWRVRAQVVDDAAWLREAPAMEALVALVGDEVLRVSAAAHRALRRISGKEFDRDKELWASWWAANKDTWKAPRNRDEKEGDAPAAGTRARFHGVEIVSDRVAFVIDFSGSMRQGMSKSDPRSRWDVVRKELSDAVALLPDGVLANAVLFSREPNAAFPKATALSKKTRDDLDDFLAKGTPAKEGNLLGGVLAALADEQVDTIFLLSDGAPSFGDHTVKERVRAAIRSANRTRKVAIHTIGVGANSASEKGFMEDVAQDAGSLCVFR